MLNVKKGDTVILHMFTGIPVGVKQVIKADKKTFTIVTGKGDTVFDKKTGYQLEPECKSDKYRNYCTEDDGSFEEYRQGRAAKPKKSSKKVNSKKAKVEEEDEEDEEERPAKKKSSKKPAKKAAPKKSKKVDDDLDDYEDAEEEDEDDEDEDEE